MNYLFLLLMSVMPAFSADTDEADCLTNEDYSSFSAEVDGWWMANTDLVLVVSPAHTATLESAMYVGPQGAPYELERRPRVVTESLMGSVASGKVEVWNDAHQPTSVPESGILFVNRWAVPHVTGGLGTLEPMYDVYASDAVGITSDRRQLTFSGDEVIAEEVHKICVGTTSLLRECDEGETPSTPDEVVSHLRTQLSGLHGKSIDGASF